MDWQCSSGPECLIFPKKNSSPSASPMVTQLPCCCQRNLIVLLCDNLQTIGSTRKYLCPYVKWMLVVSPCWSLSVGLCVFQDPRLGTASFSMFGSLGAAVQVVLILYPFTPITHSHTHTHHVFFYLCPNGSHSGTCCIRRCESPIDFHTVCNYDSSTAFFFLHS